MFSQQGGLWASPKNDDPRFRNKKLFTIQHGLFQLGLERKRRRWQPMRWKISRQKNGLPIPCHVTTPLSDRKSLSP
jgi:hypothetical protein